MDTLELEKARLTENREKGTHCNACGQFVKLYRRQIYATIARALITVYKSYGENSFHINDVIDPVANARGDFQKIRFWGLVENVPDETPTLKKSSGRWKLTPKGIAFILSDTTIPKYVYLYDGQVKGFGGSEVTIRQCLGKEFSYYELMNGRIECLQ